MALWLSTQISWMRAHKNHLIMARSLVVALLSSLIGVWISLLSDNGASSRVPYTLIAPDDRHDETQLVRTWFAGIVSDPQPEKSTTALKQRCRASRFVSKKSGGAHDVLDHPREAH